MGRTHATSGAVAFLALVPPLRAAGVDLSGFGVAVGAVAAAGGAMLPDLDYPSASVAHAAGPFTGGIAALVGWLSGGHRHGTHSLAGIAAVVLAGCGLAWAGGIIAGLGLAFLAAIMLAALRLQLSRATCLHTLLCLAVGVALTALTVGDQIPTGMLPWALGIGAAAHVAGDCLTTQGCPLLWPAGWRLSLLNLSTHGPVERFLVGPALGVVAVILAWHLTDTAALTHHLDSIQTRIRTGT